MDLDMDKYVMRCAECGAPLTGPEVLAWLAQWREICAEVDAIEESFRAQGMSVRLYKDLRDLADARWFPPCDRCRTVAQSDVT
jgi:hypothetical protein